MTGTNRKERSENQYNATNQSDPELIVKNWITDLLEIGTDEFKTELRTVGGDQYVRYSFQVDHHNEDERGQAGSNHSTIQNESRVTLHNHFAREAPEGYIPVAHLDQLTEDYDIRLASIRDAQDGNKVVLDTEYNQKDDLKKLDWTVTGYRWEPMWDTWVINAGSESVAHAEDVLEGMGYSVVVTPDVRDWVEYDVVMHTIHETTNGLKIKINAPYSAKDTLNDLDWTTTHRKYSETFGWTIDAGKESIRYARDCLDDAGFGVTLTRQSQFNLALC